MVKTNIQMQGTTSASERWVLFDLIKEAATIQSERVMPANRANYFRSKSSFIDLAIKHLCKAIILKNRSEGHNPPAERNPYEISSMKLKEDSIRQMDLSSLDSMLDARVKLWEDEIPYEVVGGQEYGRGAGYAVQPSVRQAVDISRMNFANLFGGTWGPLWGETTALTEFKEKLRQSGKMIRA